MRKISPAAIRRQPCQIGSSRPSRSRASASPIGTPSTQKDLDTWMQSFQSPFTHLWDAGNKNLGIFYDSAALPWNCTLNAKTMEILDAGVGAQGKLTAEEVLAYVDDMLALAAR